MIDGIKETFCHECHMKCKLAVKVANEKVAQVKKYSCVKGRFVAEKLYHPERLLYPLRRMGERGEGKWQRLSWEQTLNEMAERLTRIIQAHGPEAICTITGSFHKENAASAGRMFGYLLGTPNILDANHLCSPPDSLAQRFTYGDSIRTLRFVDYQNTRCILIWGFNATETHPAQAREMLKAKARGAKLIVIDPRPTKIATKADLWLRVRPGADAALALAMINVVIDEELYDKDFVENWCLGFDELRSHVQPYTPEKMADVTWVSAQDIVNAARLFATETPSCMQVRLGGGAMHINTVQTSRATAILMALLGNIDKPGGNLLTNDLGGFKSVFEIPGLLRLSPEKDQKRFGANEFPIPCGPGHAQYRNFIAHMPTGIKAMLNGQVKGFYIPGNNIVVEEGNSRQVWAALKNLDFLAVADMFMTPTAQLADFVLPTAHWLETESPTHTFECPYNEVIATQKVVEPLGECWDDRKIVLELAKKMGIDSPWKSVEDFNDYRLEKLGITFEELKIRPSRSLEFPVKYKKYEDKGFNTPSGKVELYSREFQRMGYEPLPHPVEPPGSPLTDPELAQEYPFILIQSRHEAYQNTEGRQLPSLRGLVPEPLIEINPAAAKQMGIKAGDEVWLKSPQFEGRISGKAKFVLKLHPQVVSVLFGWWFPEAPGPDHGCFQSNVNAIIDNGPPYDPIFGHYQARALPCKVGKGGTRLNP